MNCWLKSELTPAGPFSLVDHYSLLYGLRSSVSIPTFHVYGRRFPPAVTPTVDSGILEPLLDYTKSDALFWSDPLQLFFTY